MPEGVSWTSEACEEAFAIAVNVFYCILFCYCFKSYQMPSSISSSLDLFQYEYICMELIYAT